MPLHLVHLLPVSSLSSIDIKWRARKPDPRTCIYARECEDSVGLPSPPLSQPSPRASLLGSRNGSATFLARISGAFRSRSLSSASLALGRAHAHSLGIGGALRSNIELVLGHMSLPSSPPATSIVRLGDASDVNGTYCLADGEEDWDSFYVNFFADRDVFMRFRGGGVGHLGTHYLDSRLKKHNHESGYEEQHEATVDDMFEDSNSHPHEEWGNGIEEDSGTHEERTSWRKPINEEDKEDEDEDKDVDEDEDTDNEQEVGQHGQRARP
ncbi:hypothetical protein F5888DRAFT_1907611 [Russula emetica]|nr:hypothetical protein F5888DRAFT_1907611 [Russula emetica]